METEEEKRAKQAQQDATRFLNPDKPEFAQQAPTGWDKFKNFANEHKVGLGLGAAGALAGNEVNNMMHDSNIQELQNTGEAITQGQENFNNLNLDKINTQDVPEYTQNIDSTNKGVQDLISRLNDTSDGTVGKGDIQDSKGYLADKIFNKENGIHDTLSADTKAQLKAAGITSETGGDSMFHDAGNHHEDIQSDMDDIVKGREEALVKNEVVQQNKNFVNDQTLAHNQHQAVLQNDQKEYQQSIADHPSSRLGAQAIGAGSAVAAGMGAKKLYDNYQDKKNNTSDNPDNPETPSGTEDVKDSNGPSGPSGPSEETSPRSNTIVPQGPQGQPSGPSTYHQPTPPSLPSPRQPSFMVPQGPQKALSAPQAAPTILKGWKSPIDSNTANIVR